MKKAMVVAVCGRAGAGGRAGARGSGCVGAGVSWCRRVCGRVFVGENLGVCMGVWVPGCAGAWVCQCVCVCVFCQLFFTCL